MHYPEFDPELPADHSPLSAAEMRQQLTALKRLVDAQTEFQTALMERINSVVPPSLTVSDPPTAAEVQALAGKLSELIATLKG